MADEPIVVENVEQVTVAPSADHHLAYSGVIMAVTAAVILGFMAVTYSVLVGRGVDGVDAATRGSIIQTWNNIFIAAVSFWLGSSLGGKVTKK